MLIKKDYKKLKELLETTETFPLTFTFKFIGDHTAEFQAACAQFESEFPLLIKRPDRESSGGKHLAKTYDVTVQTADAIILIYERIESIPGLRIVL